MHLLRAPRMLLWGVFRKILLTANGGSEAKHPLVRLT